MALSRMTKTRARISCKTITATSTSSELKNELASPTFWGKGEYHPSQTLVWGNIFLFMILHTLSIIGLFIIFKIQVKTFVFMFSIGTWSGFGITAGAHRLWYIKIVII